MIKYVISSFLIFLLLKQKSDVGPISPMSIEDTMSVASIESQLGKDYSQKEVNLKIANVSVEAGASLVTKGFAIKKNGGKTKKQSNHFVCTSCHNITKEQEDLTSLDPQARLVYTSSHGLPYLQGSPLYGAINRESFYNGDYYLKYGDLVKPARNNIREAIKLCAVQCSQGRALKDWEVESILAYLWTIDIKISDLGLTDDSKSSIVSAIEDKGNKTVALAILEKAYLKQSPATFHAPPMDRSKGTGHEGDPKNGHLLYRTSCLHCHENSRYSYLSLDDSAMSRKYLKKHMDSYHRQSIYQVVRWGVPVKSGKPSYMPQYTLEKMSDQQLEDLRVFLRMDD